MTLGDPMNEHQADVERGERFKFGKNWQAFLSVLDEERIKQAERSLTRYLETDSLGGLTFVDVGSGSGLFSLAARRLGARVYSFDYDPQSVHCTNELKARYFRHDRDWIVEEASILDDRFVQQLGKFDIVYSWGVLHHTGDMQKALMNSSSLVRKGGILYIALYNDQGYWSSYYASLKRAYNKSPRVGQWLIAAMYVSVQVLKGGVKDLLLFHNPLRRFHEKKTLRGMSMWHDWIDWVGGYPFEVSRPEEIIDLFHGEDFTLQKLKTCGGSKGCNEYLFVRSLTRRSAWSPS
jgi:2-polyprenyl-6-hydroxyphenyl methylase/3-demethylubiquinone-9 3-methyltransferase